jgi:tetratricopeptide (TPR) repeat protein
MNVFDWLTGCFSNRRKAMALYKRGMAMAKKHDHQGAIEAYTKTLGMSDTPADLRGMLLYNRALVYAAAGDNSKGADDLEALLAMNKASANIKTMARQKLARMESRSS